VLEETKSGELRIQGRGLFGFEEPSVVLDAGNSGTTVRLLSGLLAGLPLHAVLSGDRSLSQRPMLRVVDPLRRMGALIQGRAAGKYLPLSFLPGNGRLEPLEFTLPVASAQVKSALLLAALRATGDTLLSGELHSRDHTERMFRYLQLPLADTPNGLLIKPADSVPAFELDIPGDISSAAFFIAAALICRRELIVHRCGLNPTRLGFVAVMRRMGARIDISEDRSDPEPVGTIAVFPSDLKGVVVNRQEIPDLIDEIPLLAVLGAFAEGTTSICGAEELRLKESDRIAATVGLLRAVGGSVSEREDGFDIEGPGQLRSGTISAGGDHRMAMCAAVLSSGIPDGVIVEGFEAARVSYPDFVRDFERLGGRVQ
jgi:3-phosphoshikimate 1-carboxyvinyltransferase